MAENYYHRVKGINQPQKRQFKSDKHEALFNQLKEQYPGVSEDSLHKWHFQDIAGVDGIVRNTADEILKQGGGL